MFNVAGKSKFKNKNRNTNKIEKFKIQITKFVKNLIRKVYYKIVKITTLKSILNSLYLNSWNSLDKLNHQGIVEALN